VARSSRRLGGACAIAFALVLAHAAAAAAETLVVAPGAVRQETPCEAGANACEFAWAMKNAAGGDVVQFEAGEYDWKGTNNNSIEVPVNVTLQRAPGVATRPVIKQIGGFPTCSCATVTLYHGDVLRDLAVEQTSSEPAGAGALAVETAITIERALLRAQRGGVYSFSGPPGPTQLRDTVVVSGNGRAIQAAEAITMNLDNVTAIAGGAEGIALEVTGTGTTLNATNTILRGGLWDLEAGEHTTANLHYSDARSSRELALPTGKINDSDHPMRAEPQFLPGSSYQEQAGSPTIDAGTSDPASGLLDVEGHSRTNGPATDIGAFEYQYVAPLATTGPAGGVTSRAATLTGTVNPDGLATTWYFNYGPTSAFGSRSPAGSLAGAFSTQPVSARLEGLTPGVTYHYELVASSLVGAGSGTVGTFVTPALPASPAPADSSLRLSRKRFHAAVRGATIQAASGRVGTIVSYRDSQTATTTFTVLRPTEGVRSGRRCIARGGHTRHAGHHKRCTAYIKLGPSFAHEDGAGSNRFRFSGRLAGHKLAPGKYRLSATPRNAAGETGATLTVSFTIVR
jgi:hypothetical protein